VGYATCEENTRGGIMGAWDVAKPYIAIGIPHPGVFPSEFVDHSYTAFKVTSPHFSKDIFLSRGSPVDRMRHNIAVGALQKPDITHILWWDSDMVAEQHGNPMVARDPNEVIKELLDADVPIISGVYRAKKKEGFCYCMFLKQGDGDEIKLSPVTGWTSRIITVDVVGMGCCLVKREVFEKVPQPWFWWDRFSEDFNFCLKAAKYGFPTQVLTTAVFSHIEGNFKILSNGRIVTCEV